MGFSSRLLLTLLVVSIGINAYFFIKDSRSSDKPSVTIVVGEPVIMHTNGGALEVSTIQVTERYEQRSTTTILGAPIPGSEVLATFEAPVTYRYQVLLAPEWRFFKRDDAFVVVAPPVIPALPVAFDTTRMRVFSGGLWSPITGRNATDSLLHQMTPLLAERAASTRYIELQRNEARKTVAEFVRKWVISQDRWKNLGNIQIQVFFADEPADALKAAGYALAPYKL